MFTEGCFHNIPKDVGQMMRIRIFYAEHVPIHLQIINQTTKSASVNLGASGLVSMVFPLQSKAAKFKNNLHPPHDIPMFDHPMFKAMTSGFHFSSHAHWFNCQIRFLEKIRDVCAIQGHTAWGKTNPLTGPDRHLAFSGAFVWRIPPIKIVS